MRSRRVTAVLFIGAMLLVLTAGVALADTIQCVINVKCFGTAEGDQITGTSDSDTNGSVGFFGDVIFGRGGDDTINSGDQAGIPGTHDYIEGGRGNDTIHDGGSDGANADNDVIKGGRGNDFINVKEESPFADEVNCGKGRDTVSFDINDTVKNCEILNPE